MDLRELAEMLKSGEKKESVAEEEEVLQLVGFRIGREEFGVDIHFVKEIIELPEITRVPRAPFYVEGVINLRGHIVPVIDLAKRFKLDGGEGDKVVVVEGDEIVIGIKVDDVTEVLRLPVSRIEPPHTMISGIDVEYISGIGKREDGRVVVILDVEKLLKGNKDVEA